MSIKKTNEEYLKQLYSINKNIIPLEEYDGKAIKILHKCCICGFEWKIKPEHTLNGHGCPECAKKYRSNSRKISNTEYINRVKKLHPDIDILSEYNGSHNDIKYKCKKCGYEWTGKAYASMYKNNTFGCKKCYYNKITKKQKDFEKELLEKNPDIILIDEYKNSYEKCKFKCVKCEYNCIWYSSPQQILNGIYYNKCRMSFGERCIYDFLKDNRIKFQTQKTFDGCVNKTKLQFDFYLPDLNMCIEFDGIQHYYPVNFNGCSDDKAVLSFNNTQFNDKIKTAYCKNNNINLLRISYKDIDNIFNILKKEVII